MLDVFSCNNNENNLKKAGGDKNRARKLLSTNPGN